MGQARKESLTRLYGHASQRGTTARRIEDDANLSYRLVGDWVPHWEK